MARTRSLVFRHSDGVAQINIDFRRISVMKTPLFSSRKTRKLIYYLPTTDVERKTKEQVLFLHKPRLDRQFMRRQP